VQILVCVDVSDPFSSLGCQIPRGNVSDTYGIVLFNSVVCLDCILQQCGFFQIASSFSVCSQWLLRLQEFAQVNSEYVHVIYIWSLKHSLDSHIWFAQEQHLFLSFLVEVPWHAC
jgi:hypothetical protein